MPYTPNVIIINGVPAVNVTMGGTVTYQQFLSSLGAYVYVFESMYIYTNNPAQLGTPINYTYLDSTGNQETEWIQPVVDPYQTSNALVVDLKKFDREIVIDDGATFSFNLLPLTYLKFVFFGKQTSVTDYLAGIDTFTQVAIEMGQDDYFTLQQENIENGRPILIGIN